MQKKNFLILILIIILFLFINMKGNIPNRESFIKKMVPYAQKTQKKYGYYASVIIAQAALESDFGKSTLSQAPNFNLFGIKYDGTGQSVDFRTKEQNPDGEETEIIASFQKYNSFEESFEAYGKLFTKSQWLKNFYYDYIHAQSVKEALDALTGNYATDIDYNIKLQKIIDEFNLNQYNLK